MFICIMLAAKEIHMLYTDIFLDILELTDKRGGIYELNIN